MTYNIKDIHTLSVAFAAQVISDIHDNGYNYEDFLKDAESMKDYEDFLKDAESMKDSDFCASHDYCDANQSMLDAFEKVMGREYNYEQDTDLVNDAWTLSKISNFYVKKS